MPSKSTRPPYGTTAAAKETGKAVPTVTYCTDANGNHWGFWFDTNGVLRMSEPATIEAAGFNYLTGGTPVPVSVTSGIKIARGRHTTVAASDTVVTGLATVVAVVVSLETDPADNTFLVSATIGDQAGAPAAGSVLIKSWQNTTGTDPTPVAAAVFSKVVNWIAIGT